MTPFLRTHIGLIVFRSDRAWSLWYTLTIYQYHEVSVWVCVTQEKAHTTTRRKRYNNEDQVHMWPLCNRVRGQSRDRTRRDINSIRLMWQVVRSGDPPEEISFPNYHGKSLLLCSRHFLPNPGRPWNFRDPAGASIQTSTVFDLSRSSEVNGPRRIITKFDHFLPLGRRQPISTFKTLWKFVC